MTTRTAPAAVHRPRDGLNPSLRKSMGLPPAGVDPMPMRRAMFDFIELAGQAKARDMAHLCGGDYTPGLNWLRREGYIKCTRAGTAGALWSATPAGTKWATPVQGVVVPARSIAFAGCVTESRDLVWPDVRGGSMRAFELQSRGME